MISIQMLQLCTKDFLQNEMEDKKQRDEREYLSGRYQAKNRSERSIGFPPHVEDEINAAAM